MKDTLLQVKKTHRMESKETRNNSTQFFIDIKKRHQNLQHKFEHDKIIINNNNNLFI